MIIRRFASSQQLITQPAHAALAERIMCNWQADGLPESPRRTSILEAIARHDDGWADTDDALVVDEANGQLLDFIEVPDQLKRDTSSRGIERLSSDPTLPPWLRSIGCMSIDATAGTRSGARSSPG